MNKKLIGVALLLTLATSLGACNSKSDSGPGSTGSSPSETPAASPSK